jgi:hypothetical protein
VFRGILPNLVEIQKLADMEQKKKKKKAGNPKAKAWTSASIHTGRS